MRTSIKSSESTPGHILTATLLIVFALASRFVPHPVNFSPLAAVALFAGANLGRLWAIFIPLIALLISDAFLGLYPDWAVVYFSFAVITFIGASLRSERGPL